MNMAHLKVLKTDSDYRAALHEAEILVERDPQHGSEEADRLELLTLLIETFEEQSFPIDLPDPIDAIEFRMEEQGLRQKDLVSFIGSRSRVSEVLSRKRPLTIPMIRALSDGLGIPLEALVAANRKNTIADASNRSSLDWNKFPFREMDKRGWFDVLSSKVSGSPEEVIKAFFAQATTTSAALYRRRLRGEEMDEKNYYSTLAWTARVLIRAKSLESGIPAFDAANISAEVLRDLGRLSWLEQGPRLAQEFLWKLGIILLVEPRLPNTLVDGAAILTAGGTPIVALTLRIDRIDYFWFTLMHECVHVWKHLRIADEAYVDRLESGESNDREEKEANRFARDAFIQRAIWKRSDAFLSPSREAIQELADAQHIHPAIVAGRIQRETGRYEQFREFIGQGLVRRHFSEVNETRQ
jgi:HTH-type transcriptional regulator / antitoxin HigA